MKFRLYNRIYRIIRANRNWTLATLGIGYRLPYLLPFPFPLQHNEFQQSHLKVHTLNTKHELRPIKLYDSDFGGKDVDGFRAATKSKKGWWVRLSNYQKSALKIF